MRMILPVLCLVGTRALAGDAADLANRIEFGFYAGDRGVIAAALAELGPNRDRNADLGYLFALGNFRLAELADDEAALSDCADSAGALVDQDSGNVEARILLAVCSYRLAGAEPLRAPLHTRRAERALSAALEIEPANPRALLVAAGAVEDPAERLAMLDAAVSAFDGGASQPTDWGEAEIQTLRARTLLERGEWRAARDAIEQALLAAPDYRAALALRSELASAAH